MKTQIEFQHGVNKKATTDTASCAEAEKGETTKQQVNFKCNVAPAKGYKPKAGPQMNFPNGQ